ncbi:hypothetical protein BDB01DRAFT_835632 [Pilobolus umbonatus]|nr:hypothetical protein BDB01DRAFT_835632 [Pilobolus umbonatus]
MLQLLKRLYSTQWTYLQAQTYQKSLSRQSIPKEHVITKFSRSSGPGGQNVNKVNTKVELRLLLSKCTWIPDYAKDRMRQTKKIGKGDELIVTSDRTRSQLKNMEDCYDKLIHTIQDAVAVTKEADERTLLRVKTLQSIEDKRRKEHKIKQSQKKSERRSKGRDY